LDRIVSVCRSAGRDPSEVRVVAVTKSVAPALAAELAALGVSDLGESRADALAEKRRWFEQHGRSARWHFVGHLQRNKARRVLLLADEIHSVDSAELWETLVRVAQEEGRFPGLYLQAKLSAEPTKSGLDPAQLASLVERARSGPLPLLGIMTLAPLLEDEESAQSAARSVFEAAAELARTLPAAAFAGGRVRLSMGMSPDFEQALRAGAHVLRVGSAFFAGLDGGTGSEDLEAASGSSGR